MRDMLDSLSPPIEVSKQLFVGRRAELLRLQGLLDSPAERPYVVFVTGFGGIGKSTVLATFADLARGARASVTELDGVALEEPDALRPFFEQTASPSVLLLDGLPGAAAERLLRKEIRAHADERHLIVIATRAPLDAAWRTGNGWRTKIQEMALQGLEDDDVRRYLERRRVPEALHRGLLEFCKGHPLALALAVETHLQAPQRSFTPGDDPDVVATLLERFVSEIASEENRIALEMCAITRMLREDLLVSVVGEEAARRSFAWLSGLSFVRRGPLGLYPHELAREVIVRELRWRNPSRFERLFLAVRERLARVSALAGAEAALETAFLMRHVPRLERHVMVSAAPSIRLARARADHGPELRAMVLSHEGEEQVDLFERWFEAQPERFAVALDECARVVGFVCDPILNRAPADLVERDAVARATWSYARGEIGNERGDIHLVRFWMSRDRYQEIDDVFFALSGAAGAALRESPTLAMTFARFMAGESREAPMAAMGGRLVSALAHRHAGRDFVVCMFDRRKLTGAEFHERTVLSLAAERPIAPTMDRAAFEQAARLALRTLNDPLRLKANALLDLPVFAGAGDAAARAARLRAVLLEQISALRGTPSGDRLHAVMMAAYVRPAETHERAAEACAMSYSTFRRCMADATARVIDALGDL